MDHRCDLGVPSLPLTQRIRVRSPVGSISWMFFPGFILNRKKNVRKFGPQSSRVSFGQHNPKPYSSVSGRRRSLILDVYGHR